MRTIGISLLFLSIFAVLCVYVIKTIPITIQSAIQASIQAQFEANALPGIQITMDGRDATLLGSLDSQQKINQAMKLAGGVEGVRVVMPQLTLSSQEVNPDATDSEKIPSNDSTVQ